MFHVSCFSAPYFHTRRCWWFFSSLTANLHLSISRLFFPIGFTVPMMYDYYKSDASGLGCLRAQQSHQGVTQDDSRKQAAGPTHRWLPAASCVVSLARNGGHTADLSLDSKSPARTSTNQKEETANLLIINNFYWTAMLLIVCTIFFFVFT